MQAALAAAAQAAMATAGSKVKHPLATMNGDGFSSSGFVEKRKSTGGNRHMEMPDSTPIRFFRGPPCVPSTSQIGRQGLSQPLKLFDFDDLEDCYQALDDVMVFDDAANTAGRANAAIYLNDAYATMCITNVTNFPVWFDIYDLRARHDMKNSSTEDFDPLVSFTSGILEVDPSEPVTGQMDPRWIGVTPFMSQKFVQRWNVKKVTRVNLSPGGVHTHSIHWAPNEFIRRTRWKDYEETAGNNRKINDYLEHLTHYVMIIQGGVPGITNPLELEEECTYTASKLAVCCHKEFVIRWATEQVPLVKGYNSIPAGEPYTIAEGVNPETGNVEAPAAVGMDP